jgi:phosphoglycerate dehydrogenase-like enzyme
VIDSHTPDLVSPSDDGTDRDYLIATTERGALGLAGWGPLPRLLTDYGRPKIGYDIDLRDVHVLWRRSDLSRIGVENAVDLMRELRWVHCDSAGVDDLPLATLEARGVVVTKTSAYTWPVAEWVLTACLTAARHVPDYVRAGCWHTGSVLPARLLRCASVAIIGRGDIGFAAGELLEAVGATVRYIGSDTDVLRAARGVDYLVVACPLTDATRGLVDSDVLGRLGYGATVVNVSRGGVVDEDDMLAALDSGRVGFYASDVWVQEPLSRLSTFWERPNVLVTPHEAWRARGTTARQVLDFCQQWDRYVTHGIDGLRRKVDFGKGY